MQIKNDIQACLKILNEGGIILYPTDTIWGIGCDATNAEAVSKIYALKKRAEDKSMIILLANEKDIQHYTFNKEPGKLEYLKNFKKPVTVIYNEAKNIAENLVNKDGSIGIRIVHDLFCRELILAFGKPIVSTSSNVTGYPPPRIFTEIGMTIKNGVDYIVRHRQDDKVPGMPSALIRFQEDDTIEILRP